jgi:Flp pilus assembly protein TadG
VSSRSKRRRGSIAVLAALLIGVVFAMVAFAVDLGYIVHARTELQRTADACALGAAWQLPDRTAALAYAQQIALENRGSVGPELPAEDVVFGYWDRNKATFTSPLPANYRANAVRVTLRRTEASNNPLQLFFARVIGTSLADVTASAIAWSDRGVCGPFVGIEWLDVGGVSGTDSFDSTTGQYDPATAADRGDICSDGNINVHGSAVINGNATAGVDGVVDVDGSSQITGYIHNRITPLHLPPVDGSLAASNNDNLSLPPLDEGPPVKTPLKPNNDFTLNAGEIYDMPPGVYYFRNVTLNGGATLNISGDTKIYIYGTLKRAGGCYVNNETKLAQNLQILMIDGTVDVTSENPFYGVIYAPRSNVTVNGNADFFGAIVGNTLKFSGSGKAHYDESLDLEYLDVRPRTMLVD